MPVEYRAAYDRCKGKPYAECFRCPGGELCLDFSNSGQGIRGGSGEERIRDFADLIDWLELAGSLSRRQAAALRAEGERSPKAAQAFWRRALEFREAMARIFIAKARGDAPQEEDLRLLEAEYARTAPYGRLVQAGGAFRWTVDEQAEALDAALRPLAESAVSLLTSPRLARLRRCGNQTCYWLFIDETKNCSRRWCEMASCGNLMKVRRHRARATSRP